MKYFLKVAAMAMIFVCSSSAFAGGGVGGGPSFSAMQKEIASLFSSWEKLSNCYRDATGLECADTIIPVRNFGQSMNVSIIYQTNNNNRNQVVENRVALVGPIKNGSNTFYYGLTLERVSNIGSHDMRQAGNVAKRFRVYVHESKNGKISPKGLELTKPNGWNNNHIYYWSDIAYVKTALEEAKRKISEQGKINGNHH